MDDIQISTIEWQAPEYTHKERSVDFFWTIGLVTLVACIAAIWFGNYIFAIFIFISGACLILFSIRPPQEIHFEINNEGISLGRDKHPWSAIKGFHIKNGEPYSKLLIETTKYFLPIFNLPLPMELSTEVKDTLIKIIPDTGIDESPSMQFMDKLGF